MSSKLYEITLDETQLMYLQNALKCHVVKLVEDRVEDDTSEVPEEVNIVQDMYFVLKDFTDDDFTLEEPFSKTQELMWIKEIDLDEQYENKLVLNRNAPISNVVEEFRESVEQKLSTLHVRNAGEEEYQPTSIKVIK